MATYKGSSYFYKNYLRGFLRSDHSHARHVFNSVLYNFPKSNPIRQQLDTLNSSHIGSMMVNSKNIEKMSDEIAQTIPLKYRIMHQVEEAIYKWTPVKYDTPMFDRFAI